MGSEKGRGMREKERAGVGRVRKRRVMGRKGTGGEEGEVFLVELRLNHLAQRAGGIYEAQ